MTLKEELARWKKKMTFWDTPRSQQRTIEVQRLVIREELEIEFSGLRAENDDLKGRIAGALEDRRRILLASTTAKQQLHSVTGTGYLPTRKYNQLQVVLDDISNAGVLNDPGAAIKRSRKAIADILMGIPDPVEATEVEDA